MAKTTPASGSRVALYANTFIPESLKNTIVGQLMGDNGALQIEKQLSNNAGTSFTSTLITNLTGAPIIGEAGVVDGNESPINSFTDTVSVDMASQSVLIPTSNNVDQHAVGWDYKKTGYEQLKTWVTGLFEIWFFNNLSGNTASQIGVGSDTLTTDGIEFTNPLGATGLNAATAPTTNRIVRAAGAATDQALTATDTVTLSLADVLREKAITATPQIAPLNYKGRAVHVWIVSTEQMTDLVRDNASSIQLTDIVLADLSGGNNMMYNEGLTGRGFEYRGVLILESTRVAYGVNSATSTQISTVRRSLFLGRGAATMGIKGKGFGQASFHETDKNGGKQLQITAHIIGGMKKRVFNGEDYGVIVCSTYAAPHTS